MAVRLFSTVIHLCIAVLYLFDSASVSSGIGEVCILGSTEVTETSFLNSGSQYLDFGHPAPCTGKLTAWHFCYYAADISLTFFGQVRDYVVEFRVWRTVDGDSFSRIHNDRMTMGIAPPSDGQTLICETDTLRTPLDVLTGDILGVYIFTTDTLGEPLHIIARDTSDFGLYFDTRDPSGPDFIPFRSETVSIDDLESRPTVGLHLYADIVIDCGGLSGPENGQVTISPGLVAQTGVGATATYTCNTSAGYMLVGTVMRTCQDSGQWSGMDPTCIRCDIASITAPGNGSVTITSPGGVLTAVYTCDVGYTVVGVATRTCQSDGQFSGQEPVCQVIMTQRQNSGPVIGGVVVALLVAAVIALGIILAVIYRRQRRRHGVDIQISSTGNGFKDLSNPVYSGTADENTFDDPMQVTGTGKPFGTLTSSTADYIEVDDPKPNSGLVAEHPSRIKSEHYEMPEKRNIYNTMSDGSLQRICASYEEPVPTPRNSFELSIHVPTKAQREALTQSGSGEGIAVEGASGVQENVYEALAEVQRATASTVSSAFMTFFEEADTYWAPSSDPSELYEQLAIKKYREIPRNQIQIVEHLGAGQFGTVNKGTWQSTKTVEVAVKMLNARAGDVDKVKFLQEAAINGQFRHPNVVKLLGVVTVGEPTMIVLEFLANGDLKQYLIKQRPVPGELLPSQTPRTFLGFCQQVASGMEYLSRKAFVHRDLAARNVLVSENKTCKISDFGMSRDLMDESYYVSQGGKIPVKWTAPEALNFKKYTTASDVWSYGVVMYEIWSLGHKPFEGYTNQKTIELVDSGYRLPPPPGCSKKLYTVMMQCWHPQKSSRPSFLQIVEALSEPECELLCWTEEDVKVHPQAMVLGAQLDAGRELYPELQTIYNQQQSS